MRLHSGNARKEVRFKFSSLCCSVLCAATQELLVKKFGRMICTLRLLKLSSSSLCYFSPCVVPFLVLFCSLCCSIHCVVLFMFYSLYYSHFCVSLFSVALCFSRPCFISFIIHFPFLLIVHCPFQRVPC